MKNLLSTIRNITGLLVFLAVLADNSAAQIKITSALVKSDSIEIPTTLEDTLQLKYNSMKIYDERSPKSGSLAMLMSAIVPGSGQLYAHRYYTIPIIWGFGYYFFSKYKDADDKYKEYKSLYTQSLTDSTQFHLQRNYKSLREDWHNFRDEMGVYLILTYLLNIIDAYVGATLYDFSVSDELGVNANIRFQIPIR